MMSELYAPAQGAANPQLPGSVTIENTCTATMRAPFATPLNVCPAGAPLPAAMPATCVPCMHVSSEHGTAAPVPNCCPVPFGHVDWLTPSTVLEKQASSITLPARNGWLRSTPVSRIATTVPPPS